MKNTPKSSTKGFTLVELIVVIVILAILATIAFLSFSSQSSAARDSKRKTDLSSISSKINVSQATGTPLLSMVADDTNLITTTGSNLAGVDISDLDTTTEYKAGKLNYTSLGIKAEDFKDPQGDEYPIGATMKVGGAFQLAAKVENDSDGNVIELGAVLSGNYAPRTVTGMTVTNTASGVLTVADTAVGYFRIGDSILLNDTNTSTCTIKSISSDKTKITLETCDSANDPSDAGNATLGIVGSETTEVSSLIGSGGVAIENGSNVPY